jgi:hypothetical protein
VKGYINTLPPLPPFLSLTHSSKLFSKRYSKQLCVFARSSPPSSQPESLAVDEAWHITRACERSMKWLFSRFRVTATMTIIKLVNTATKRVVTTSEGLYKHPPSVLPLIPHTHLCQMCNPKPMEMEDMWLGAASMEAMLTRKGSDNYAMVRAWKVFGDCDTGAYVCRNRCADERHEALMRMSYRSADAFSTFRVSSVVVMSH